MASGDTGNVVPGNRLRVRISCPPPRQKPHRPNGLWGFLVRGCEGQIRAAQAYFTAILLPFSSRPAGISSESSLSAASFCMPGMTWL